MDSIVRALIVYFVVMVLFRIGGKRSLAQITTFDFVLLLIISEAVQQALIANDNSMMNALLLVLTFFVADIAMSLLKGKSAMFEKLVDDVPLILVEDAKPIQERMRKERVDENDILASARMTQGLERMDQIKYAVLERSGGISIIPKEAS